MINNFCRRGKPLFVKYIKMLLDEDTVSFSKEMMVPWNLWSKHLESCEQCSTAYATFYFDSEGNIA